MQKSFDQLIIKVDNNPKSDKNLKPEGDLTTLKYIFKKSANTPSPPSDLQIMRNYQNAARQKGGTVLVDRPGYAAVKFMHDGGEVYVGISTGSGGYRMQLDILEEKAMTQEITTNLMWEKLQKDGFISLQINFDTNKATIKPDESMPPIKQIVDLMNSQPILKVSIEGHTDNQGTASVNKVLSLNRAKSVALAVAAGGIKADRMETQAGDRKSPLQITAPKKAGPSIVESSWSRSRKKYRKYKERRKISFVGLDTTNPRNESRGLVVMPDFTNCRTM